MDEWNEFITSVRQNKALLFETYGGLEGLRKHQVEEKPLLEKAGWKFVSIEEMNAMKSPSHLRRNQ